MQGEGSNNVNLRRGLAAGAGICSAVALGIALESGEPAGAVAPPPDGNYSFINAPKPSFFENGPHGMVVIEASVDARGIVTSTRVVSNDTKDVSLAAIAEREVRNARFAPPIRNCVPKAFVFTYKRAF